MNRRPDQSSSIAQILLSTRPAPRPIALTSPSERSVSIAEDPFGQAIHSIPSPVASATAPTRLPSAAADLSNQRVISRAPRFRRFRAAPSGSSSEGLLEAGGRC